MKNHILITLTFILSVVAPVWAQPEKFPPEFTQVGHAAGWTAHHVTAKNVVIDGEKAVHLLAAGDSATRIAGLLVADDVAFTTGVIELDLKGRNVPQRSFLGVAFNIADERTFEAVYFRPFNFRGDATTSRRAVQYVAWPENTWEKLRREHPGKFERSVNPVPDPESWFHARIEVTESQVRVFVDRAKEPSLVVERLASGSHSRPAGLFVDVAEGVYANLVISPSKETGK